MTEEQIEERASKFATTPREYEAYIAGAHSRDEEICRMNTTIRLYADHISQLRKEIEQLRNPWISVEERLPDEGKHVFVRTVVGSYSVGQYIYPQWYITGIPSAHGLVSVTHWMQIPQIEKGENK